MFFNRSSGIQQLIHVLAKVRQQKLHDIKALLPLKFSECSHGFHMKNLQFPAKLKLGTKYSETCGYARLATPRSSWPGDA